MNLCTIEILYCCLDPYVTDITTSRILVFISTTDVGCIIHLQHVLNKYHQSLGLWWIKTDLPWIGHTTSEIWLLSKDVTCQSTHWRHLSG